MKLKSPHCTVLSNVAYVHSPILRILRQTLLRLAIPIRCDVLNVLHNGIGHDIPQYFTLPYTSSWTPQTLPVESMTSLRFKGVLNAN